MKKTHITLAAVAALATAVAVHLRRKLTFNLSLN
ncbi:hypothetical protein SSUR61_0384 [Streptococcus suis R61]|uniref:Uncharacterized protein n=1 Tax=Streptococcus suis R61 TaxID=996306 RepID=A0AA87K5H7_STRSU|nr:hypothetical protein SSUR61_0384 [Streptococcus suis R61]